MSGEWVDILPDGRDARAEYLARLSAISDEPLIVLRTQDEELAKMVKEGLATEEDFNTWRRATSSGLVPLLWSDVANELHDRVESRMRKGVDRMVCPPGMTDLEHALLVAANCGATGRPVRDANAERKKAAEKTVKAERNAPRMKVLEAFRKNHPDCTLPEAAAALFKANAVSSVDTGATWLRRMVKAVGIQSFKPGERGRKQKSRGVGTRKPR